MPDATTVARRLDTTTNQDASTGAGHDDARRKRRAGRRRSHRRRARAAIGARTHAERVCPREITRARRRAPPDARRTSICLPSRRGPARSPACASASRPSRGWRSCTRAGSRRFRRSTRWRRCGSGGAPAGAPDRGWMDAQRRDVFTALYRVTDAPAFEPERLVELEAPTVGGPAATLARWAAQLDGAAGRVRRRRRRAVRERDRRRGAGRAHHGAAAPRRRDRTARAGTRVRTAVEPGRDAAAVRPAARRGDRPGRKSTPVADRHWGTLKPRGHRSRDVARRRSTTSSRSRRRRSRTPGRARCTSPSSRTTACRSVSSPKTTTAGRSGSVRSGGCSTSCTSTTWRCCRSSAGAGSARALLTHVLRHGASLGARRATLEVRRSNEAARLLVRALRVRGGRRPPGVLHQAGRGRAGAVAGKPGNDRRVTVR